MRRTSWRRFISLGLILSSIFATQAFAAEKDAVIKGSMVNVRAEANKNSKKVTNLYSNTAVKVGDPVQNSSGESWYPVNFQGGSGYIRSDFVKFPVQYQRDEAFENALNQQGFPEAYKDGLRALHAEFPNWQFKALHTNLDWQRVLDGEMEGTGSLVDKNAISSWKSTDQGKYDWNTGTWVGFDGPTWVGASRQLTAYYMDPRNFLDESYIFQFLLHSYNPEEQTRDGLAAMLKGSFMDSGSQGSGNGGNSGSGDASSTQNSTETVVISNEGPGANISNAEGTVIPSGTAAASADNSNTSNGTNAGGVDYVSIIMKAAEQSKQNPYVLASMILQEQGKGTSGSISGSSGHYNYFNIGAYQDGKMGAIERGIWYAKQSGSYMRPWNSREKSIVGGAQFFAENYMNAGQNTLYLKKWNVQGSNLFKHQYMTNVQGAAEEGAKLSSAYSKDMKNKALVFSIPVYKDMPGQKEPIPTGDEKPTRKDGGNSSGDSSGSGNSTVSNAGNAGANGNGSNTNSSAGKTESGVEVVEIGKSPLG